MKLTIKIQQIDLCECLLQAMPILREKVPQDGTAVSRILRVVTQLPDHVIRTMLEAVPESELQEILVLLIRENQEKIRQKLENLLKENQVEVSLEELTLSDGMELRMRINDLDYARLLQMPAVQNAVRNHAAQGNVLLTSLLAAPEFLLRGMLDRIPQETKDQIALSLLNKYSDALTAKLEHLIQKRGIQIQLSDLRAEL